MNNYNNGKDIMPEDILEQDGIFVLQIGHSETNMKQYYAHSKKDLVELIISHLQRLI